MGRDSSGPVETSVLVRNLVKAVAVLAMPADVQREYLVRFGTYPATDELATNLEDAYIEPALAELDALDREMLAQLWDHVQSFGGINNSPTWHASALSDAPAWETAREMARRFILRP